MDNYDKTHARRYAESLDFVRSVNPASVLELGEPGTFTNMLKSAFPDAHVAFEASDLRYPIPQPDGEYDLVLCMEVIEHINDQNSERPTEWNGNGAATMLAESLRVLRPGGHLLLTTPNAASVTAICHALRLAPGFVYRPHVREYAPYELDELVRKAGFEIIRRDTRDVWDNVMSIQERRSINEFIRTNGYPRDLRGEDIFMLARKPVDSRAVTHEKK